MSVWQTVWQAGEVKPVAVAELGQCYRRYRLADSQAEEAMARSLARYGQMTPVVACVRAGKAELLDGFKRRVAAAQLPGWRTLSTRVLELDERLAKAAIFALNSMARPTGQLEEAWIVQALVRDDGLSQVEAAELLGRHKSWVCRRLALLERLCIEATEELRLGLLSPSLARQLMRLPTGNQAEVLQSCRRESLTAAEVHAVVDLLPGATPEQQQLLLDNPREVLLQAARVQPVRDPRLSNNGNWVAKHLHALLDALDRMDNWLQHPGPWELKKSDRQLLQPHFDKLGRQSRRVAEQVDELLPYLQLRRSEAFEQWMNNNETTS